MRYKMIERDYICKRGGVLKTPKLPSEKERGKERKFF